MITKTTFGQIIHKGNDATVRKILFAIKKAEKRYYLLFRSKPVPFKLVLTYSNKEYDKKTGLKIIRPWRGAHVVKNKIVMLSPSVKKPDFEINSYLDHEINHKFYLGVVGSYHPGWFSEGMATYLMRTYKFDKNAYKKYYRSLKNPESLLYYRFIKKKYYKDTSLFYTLSFLVYEYLQKKYGFKKILRLLKKFSKNKSKKEFERIFIKTFNISIKQALKKSVN